MRESEKERKRREKDLTIFLSSDRCEVERVTHDSPSHPASFQDLDHPSSYFTTTAGSYTEQLAEAAVWEEKWFEQAAMIGRAMAEDRVILEQTPVFVENSTPVETSGE